MDGEQNANAFITLFDGNDDGVSCAASPSCSEVKEWSESDGVVAPDTFATLDIPGTIFKAKEIYSGIKKSIGKFKNIGDSIKNNASQLGVDISTISDICSPNAYCKYKEKLK